MSTFSQVPAYILMAESKGQKTVQVQRITRTGDKTTSVIIELRTEKAKAIFAKPKNQQKQFERNIYPIDFKISADGFFEKEVQVVDATLISENEALKARIAELEQIQAEKKKPGPKPKTETSEPSPSAEPKPEPEEQSPETETKTDNSLSPE